MSSKIPVIRTDDDLWKLDRGQDYDFIEYGYRTPDGIEWYGNRTPYTAEKTDLTTQKGQDFAQAKFQRQVELAGVKYDANKHGRLQFISRVKQVRFQPPQPLNPEFVE